MKCFRVWPDGRVDPQLPVRSMDGSAYVPAGGTSFPYISVDRELAADGVDVVTDAVFEEDASGRRVRLFAGSGEQDRRALVLVPCPAAFDFRPAISRVCRFASDNVAQLIVMEPGETIQVYPVARSLAQAAGQGVMTLAFDGEAVTFC